MSLPLLFTSGVAAWLLAWGVFLGLVHVPRDATQRDPMTLLDDDRPHS